MGFTLALAALMTFPSAASATELVNTTVSVDRAVDEPCHTGLRAASPASSPARRSRPRRASSSPA
jgi:hypothetical protein